MIDMHRIKLMLVGLDISVYDFMDTSGGREKKNYEAISAAINAIIEAIDKIEVERCKNCLLPIQDKNGTKIEIGQLCAECSIKSI
ncbi:MAG TPA: hypothetical protein ACFYEK_11055 [Candidatus Wunengus sp. YC60]|uniref:hypothetical protein n=1 Tax=Candidatus Wunengus sp. YC60 TaxID=3367697 RepID=UPI004029C555